jgi:putative spermidine/putrescine transport system substrate-binding protein
MQEDWYQANGWGVNFAGSAMVMAFNTDTVQKLPQHWHELLAPEFRGKLSMYNAPYQSLYAFAQMKAGMEGRPGKGYEQLQRDLDGVLKFAAEHRDFVKVWWTNPGDFLNKLLQREIVGGVVHLHGPLAAEAEGKPVKIVSPDEGTAIVQVFWSIPKGTKVKRLAEELINDFFATDFQLKRGVDALQATPNLKAAEQAGRESKLYAKFLPTTLASWDQLRYYPYDVYFSGQNWTKINDFWEREVLTKKRT